MGHDAVPPQPLALQAHLRHAPRPHSPPPQLHSHAFLSVTRSSLAQSCHRSFLSSNVRLSPSALGWPSSVRSGSHVVLCSLNAGQEGSTTCEGRGGQNVTSAGLAKGGEGRHERRSRGQPGSRHRSVWERTTHDSADERACSEQDERRSKGLQDCPDDERDQLRDGRGSARVRPGRGQGGE